MTKDDRELIERLRAKRDTGRRTLGGGTAWSDGKAGESWGGEPIFEYVNPDGPVAATRLEALQAQPVGEESGWLIEENASGIIHWIALAENEWPRTEIHVRRARSGRDMMVETDKYRSPVVRVKDANEALRFARKEDAEALIKLFDRFLLCPVATEHMWSAAR